MEIVPAEAIAQVDYVWYRESFYQFISSFTGLALSILAASKFVFLGMKEHTQQNEMLSKLYGGASQNRARRRDSQCYSGYYG